ncbi:MAG: ABC transporter substrate-binding protein [Clostridia bacterium]|nr:ABC transporter substrate-binding protein [Clostridia bacterium]
MTLKRILACILCVMMLITCFSGCNVTDKVKDTINEIQNPEPDPGIDEVGYTLPYLRTDSLNPYKCESETNRNIMTLIYDSLFSVNNDFKVESVIANSYILTENTLTVTLKSDVKFSDGSTLSPADVVYSFVLAKGNNYYSAYLKNITDAQVNGIGSVVFTLRDANPYETANLIFPIIKSDSDKDSDSSDSYSAELPSGSGRYFIKDDKSGKALHVNKARLGGYHPKYNIIGLKDITEVSSIPNLFSLGEIDFYTESFSDGIYKRFSGESGTYETTNLTYLGINANTRVLQESKVRRAIALLINRNDLASVSFAGFGVATSTPFNPSFYALDGCTLPPMKFDKNAAVGLLEEAGFDIVSEIGIRYSSSNQGKLELRLLVNKDNSFKLAMARNIQQALAKADIRVVLKELSYSRYIDAVESGAYDLYIGEAKLTNSFDLSVFFSEDGALGYGIDSECATAVKYNSFEESDITMQEFLDTFADDLPFIPLAYRKGLTVRNEKIKTKTSTIISDYFFNINEWTVE